MKKVVPLLLLAALICGCCRNYRDTTLYQTCGRAKPVVAVLPVICSSEIEPRLPWDVSQELTEEISMRLIDSPKLYLLREEGDLEMAKQLNDPNPSRISPALCAAFGDAQFIIVSELVQEKQTIYGPGKMPKNQDLTGTAGATLELAMRVRVIDIRCPTPKVILQEMVECDHEVARSYLYCDYKKNGWGSDSFKHTPVGIAHSKLIRTLVAHIEGYVGSV